MNEQEVKTGTSITGRQFMAIASGEVAVHKPRNPFRVVSLQAEERYCFSCFGIRWFDIFEGHGYRLELPCRAAFCRCCGAEVLG